MSKKLHFKSLLLLATMLFGASSAWAEDTWVKTDFADLETDDVVVIADAQSSFALPNDNGTSSAPSAVEITLSSDKTEITTAVDIKIQWVVTETETGLQFGVEKTKNNLYCTNNNNGVRVGTNENNIFTIKENFLYNIGQSRYLGVYNKQDWRCYTTIHNNIKETVITFYKKIADSSDTRTETTVNISDNDTEVTMDGKLSTPWAEVKTGEGILKANVKWSSSDPSVATIDEETGEITLVAVGTTTIKATFEGDDDYKPSEASYELTVKAAASELPEYNTIGDLQKDATATETPIKFTFNNILVTAAKGKNAYITDGTYGALVYTDGHGLNAGDIINGTIETTLVLYRGQTEITGVKASDENLTITTGTVTPVEKALSEITVANQSLLVTLKGLTYNSSDKTFTDGTNKIAYYKNFTSSDPALENGKVYDVTGVVIVFNETLEISPLSIDDVVEVVSAEQEAPVSAWVSGSEEVSSICVLTNNSISVSYTTNSTGEKSFESSDTKVATVDADGNITLTGTPGVAKITAVTKENNDFFASTASLTILVAAAESEDAVFDFSLFQDYGSGMAPTSENVYVEEERTWTAGNITMKTGGKVRWYIGSSEGVTTYTLRLYGKTEPYSYMTLSAPEGYYISAIDGLAGSLKANTGKISSGTWSGMAQEVTFTYESTSKNAAMSSLKVTYTQPEFTMEIGSDYTAFSSKMALDFSESGIAVYTAKVNDGVVVLTEVESGEVPANRGVILKGTAGEHTVKLIESAEALKNNELFGVTEDTKVVYNEEESSKYNYILQNGVFKKATEAGATLKAGKAYLSTKYDVTATGARELKIVVEGEATGIKAIETAADKNVYDLQGRKVAAPQKGLYIINGKKMIVK